MIRHEQSRVNKRQGKKSLMCILTDLPFTHSVAKELEAIAEPQPKVLNLASTIFPWSSTSICHKIKVFSVLFKCQNYYLIYNQAVST